MRVRPDFAQIAAFLAVAEALNFRRAADRLGLDQSALSRRIKALEARVGFALFLRTTHAVRLTDAGESFYAANRELLIGLDAAVERAAGVARGEGAQLTVSYMSFAAVHLMPHAARRFQALRPDVRLRLQYAPTLDQIRALARGEVDVALVLGPLGPAEFATVALTSEPLMAFISKGDVLAGKPNLTLAEIAAAPAIVGDARQWDFYRARVEEILALRGLTLRVAFEAPDIVGVLGLVRAGLGVALLPRSVTALRLAGVVACEVVDCDAWIRTLAAWRRPSRPDVTAFVETLRAAARSGGDPSSGAREK